MAKVSNDESIRKPSVVLEKIAEKRSAPGVVSLTGAMGLLYMNSEAEELCHQLLQEQGDPGHGAVSMGTLPPDIHELCRALQHEFTNGNDSRDPEEIQMSRVVGESAHPILLRGFLIPGHEDHEPRYLILMEKLGRRAQVPTDEAKRHFHLTDREHEIVVNLADGRTNREIADLLEISEHTVKEHIKHILRKTESSTRTGILAQVLRFS